MMHTFGTNQRALRRQLVHEVFGRLGRFAAAALETVLDMVLLDVRGTKVIQRDVTNGASVEWG